LLDFRFPFAYALSMFPGPSARKMFVVTCKKCRRDVPSGASEFPFQSILVECPLCGEKRRYLPSEVFLGRADQLVQRQKRAGAV
jgi:RNase P subunit RPR2